jgi:TniQ
VTHVLREFTHAPRPKLGQTFASYMETLAAELLPPIDLITLLFCIGIIEEDHHRALPVAYGLTLTDEQKSNMAFTLRLTRPEIERLLLTHYDGVAFNLTPMDTQDKGTYGRAVRKNSVLFTTQRLCPCCMQAGPYYRLVHRLPWVFLCSIHKVLLSHICPRCVRPHGNFRQSKGGMPSYAAQVPDPAACRNPPPIGEGDAGRAAQPCGHPLAEITTADVSKYPRVLRTQQVIEDVLATGQGRIAGQDVRSVVYFHHLRSVVSLLDYAADPEDLGAGLPPVALESAAQHAVDRGFRDASGQNSEEKRRQRASSFNWTPEWLSAFLPAAVELLEAPSIEDLSEALVPYLSQARRFKALHFRALGTYFKFEGPLLQAFDTAVMPNACPRRRTGYTSPFSHHPDRPYAYEPDHIPQMLWLSTYRADFAPLFQDTDMGDPYIRSFIAMDLVRLCGNFGWIEAARELGVLPARAAGLASKAIGLLNNLDLYDTYLERLHATAACLETVDRPFNFGRRRRRFDDLMDFPFEEWRLEMQARDLHPGKPGGKNKWAAAHAWAMLTAGSPRRAPVFRELGDRERKNQLEVFYRFNRDHLDHLWPLIHTLALHFTDYEPLAGEADLGTQEL